MRSIENGTAKRGTKNQNDYRRFIEKTSVTSDGEVADKATLCLNTERIADEERYDGYYAVVSNLDSDPCEIIKVNKMRWKIEECFRIIKSDFKARPIYVKTENRIKAHFITCFLSLVIYRYLENVTNHRYTCDQLIETLQNMNMREVMGEGYIPAYTRTEITDTLHEIFGFRTDYQITDRTNMKKILKKTKTKIRYAKI